MQASSLCYDFVKKMEGFSAKAYDDGGGVWTIGYGTTRWDLKTPVKKGQTITEEEAQRQLEIEVHRVEDAINETVKVPLAQGEMDALISLFYNIGTGWCTGTKNNRPPQSTLVKLINESKYDAVPAQFLRFERDIHGRVIQGLVTRRKWEAQMWIAAENHAHIVAAAPKNDPSKTPMPQTVTPVKAESAVKTLASSPSAHWSIGGMFSAIAALAHSHSQKPAQALFDAGQDKDPIQALSDLVSAHGEQIGVGIAIASLFYVLLRRIWAAAEGRSF